MKHVGIAEERPVSPVEGGCGHLGKGESQRLLCLQTVLGAEGVSSAPRCSTSCGCPLPCRMGDPDLSAGAVESCFMQLLLSGPELAKTLPVYDSASHADPSLEGETMQVTLTSMFRSPDTQSFQCPSIWQHSGYLG